MRNLHLNIKIRLIESFFNSLITFMFMPFMVIYYAQYFGESIAGILIVVNTVIGLVASLYGGQIADVMGRRAVMLNAEIIRIISLIVMAISNSSFFVSPTLTFVMMIFLSIGSGFALPAAQAMVVDVSNNENRKLVYRLEYWSSNMALAIGVALGGVFFSKFLFETFLIASVASIVSLIVIKFFITESYIPKERRKIEPFKIFISYKDVWKDKIFMIYALASMLALSIEFQVLNYMGVQLSKSTEKMVLFDFDFLHLSLNGVELFGVLRSENAVIVIFFSLFVGLLSKIMKDRWLLITGVLINTMGYYFITIGMSPWFLLLMMIPATVGELMFYPVKQAYLADIAPEESRSVYMAVNSLVGRAATILGGAAITIGYWIPRWGMSLIFLITGLISTYLFLIIITKLEARSTAVVQQHKATAE